MILRDQYENEIAYLRAVCRIAADRLRNGGTFPINGETWSLLDFAAGDDKPSSNPTNATSPSARRQAVLPPDDHAGDPEPLG